jgi:hypothetical protein
MLLDLAAAARGNTTRRATATGSKNATNPTEAVIGATRVRGVPNPAIANNPQLNNLTLSIHLIVNSAPF